VVRSLATSLLSCGLQFLDEQVIPVTFRSSFCGNERKATALCTNVEYLICVCLTSVI